jgi:hypothetical protein
MVFSAFPQALSKVSKGATEGLHVGIASSGSIIRVTYWEPSKNILIWSESIG